MKTVQYHILAALAGGAIHGAEIRRRVEEQSGGSVTLYSAMLYGTLDEIKRAGWIEEEAAGANREHPRWRFYGLSPAGTQALEEETARLEALVEGVRANLEVATGR